MRVLRRLAARLSDRMWRWRVHRDRREGRLRAIDELLTRAAHERAYDQGYRDGYIEGMRDAARARGQLR